jgi:hypothetical protein
MKTFSTAIAALWISQAALAAPAPTPSPSPSVVQVTPTSMPTQMLTGNYSILNGISRNILWTPHAQASFQVANLVRFSTSQKAR